MNAKKIMGAVLVALLAAALFVGAGAAATTSPTSGDVVFLYQNISDTDVPFTAIWTTADGSAAISAVAQNDGFYFVPGNNFVEGIYYNSTIDIKDTANTTSFVVKAPSAQVLAVADGKNIIGGESSVTTVELTIGSAATKVNVSEITVAYPNGTVYAKVFGHDVPKATWKLENLPAGEYKVNAKLNKSDFADFATPKDYEVLPTYTFSIVDATKVTISTDVETVIDNGVVIIEITGPAGYYDITLTKFTLLSNGTEKTTVTGNVVNLIKSVSKATLYLKADEDGEGKIKVEAKTGDAVGKEATATVKITKGTITAKTDKESYYIGNDIVLSGTSTAGDKVYFYIEGTNKAFQILPSATSEDVKTNGEWEAELTGQFKEGYDAGTYTVYITNNPVPGTDRANLSKVTYTTAPLILKQPFISVTDAPSVAVKNTDYVVKGNAEAASEVYVYIFGTNFFAAGTTKIYMDNDNSKKEIGDVTIENDAFTIEIAVPDARDQMAAGQYFMVIQHPMYDEKFGIKPDGYKINLYNMSTATPTLKETLFTVDKRQTANAAQALCDALDTQNIDDLYVKLSFVVAAGQGTINPIPSEITQGSKLTVSGSTNVGEGKVVTVEMLSTAFAAVPKETVGSASFIALTTTTDADGNWEVTFDTTGLDIDEYTVSVAVESLDTKTAKINVIEGAPTEQPTENPTEQPTQTEQPTEAPTTPGFGALAALAGLGAVAVLLLRRE